VPVAPGTATADAAGPVSAVGETTADAGRESASADGRENGDSDAGSVGLLIADGHDPLLASIRHHRLRRDLST
jgi:hypothetical protein